MPSARPSRPGRWLLPVVLGLQLLVYLPSLVSPGIMRAPLPKLSEATNQTYPWDLLWRDEVRAGRAPFWNPYIFGGTPLIGEPQTQTFYPSHALWLVLPPELAYKLSLFLHILLGSWLMYRLVRELGADRLGASVAALVFGLHGQMTVFVYSGWIQMVAPMAWAPAVLWQLCRALRHDRGFPGRAVALGGLALGAQIICGHPEWVRYTMMMAGLLVIADPARRRAGGEAAKRRPLVERALIGASILVIGILIGGPQLLPLAQATAHSGRGQGALVGGAARHGTGLPWLSLPTIVAPSLFGPWDLSLTTDGLVHKLSGSLVSFGETLVYVGLLPLMLAGIALGRRRAGGSEPRGSHRAGAPHVWLMVALVGLVFALNDYTHAQDLLDRLLPFDSAFRSPGRFVFLTNLALAVLAGLGASALAPGDARITRLARRALIASAALAIVAGLAWLLRSPMASLALARLHAPTEVTHAAVARSGDLGGLGVWAVGQALQSLAISAAILALSAITLAWAARRLSGAGPVVILVVIALDLGWFAHPFLSSLVRVDDVYAHDRVVLAPVMGHRDVRIGATDTQFFDAGDNVAVALGVRSLIGYQSFRLVEWDRLIAELGRFPADALQFAGVTHIISRGTDGAVALAPLASPYGRAWWTDGVVLAKDDAAATNMMVDSLRAARGVVLPGQAGLAAHSIDRVYTPEDVSLGVDADVAGHIQLHLNAPRPGFVVVTEAFYPGWVARVNGSPAPVRHAFGVFQAVQVPAGPATLDLAFRPVIVWWGFGAAAIGLMLAAGAARLQPRRRGRV